LILILFSIFAYGRTTPFPSLYGLVPVVGTILVVVYADQKTITAKILSTKLLVTIGLISYSIYLWHQPIFAFGRIYTSNQISFSLSLLFLFFTFLLAALTWKFVERFFFFKKNFKRKTIFVLTTIGILTFTSIGATGYLKNGFIDRFDSEMSLLHEAISDWGYPGKLSKGNIEGLYILDKETPINVLFFGDSHADQFAPLAKDISDATNMNIGYLSGSGCPPIPNLLEDSRPYCSDIFDRLQRVLEKEKYIKTIVVAGCFNCYFIEESLLTSKFNYYYDDNGNRLYFRKGEGQRKALLSLKSFVQTLSIDKKVILIGDNPSSDSFDPKIMMDYRLRGNNSKSFSYKYPDFSTSNFHLSGEVVDLNNKLFNLIEGKVFFLNTLEIVCPENLCVSKNSEGIPYYKDGNHMRPFFVNEKFKELMIDLL